MKEPQYKIRLYQNTVVIREYCPETKAEAKRIFYHLMQMNDWCPRLYINDKEQCYHQACKHFGKEEEVHGIVLAYGKRTVMRKG